MMSIIGPDVFLGGSCNPTTWRTEIALPMLDEAEISYYNPQVDDWSPELIDIERKAKAQACNYLFVIDGQTRAIASMIEAAGLITSMIPEIMYLVVDDIPEGAEIDGALVSKRELQDLNRGRAYLRAIAEAADVTVYESVTKAVEAIIADW